MNCVPPPLAQWPCQIRLVPATAPFFKGAKLLIAADLDYPLRAAGRFSPTIRESRLLLSLLGVSEFGSLQIFVHLVNFVAK